MKKSITALVFLVILALGLCSCQVENTKPQTRVFYDVFDTVATFYDYTGSTRDEFAALADRVESEIVEYHELFDIYHEYEGKNNLATVNRLAGQGPVKVDSRIIDLLVYSKSIYELTDGNTNIAMGAVLRIWHAYRTYGVEIPPMDILQAAALHTDISKVIIDEENMTVELLDPEMSLDVGAIAKGYAVEEVAKMLEAEGLSGYVIDVGGNLRTVGTKKNGDGWKTGIKNPDRHSTERFIYYLELKNEAIVTSGSYERFYTVGGVSYHHIINKDTLMPENYYLSVSVKSPSSALSDSLSTAIFNMPLEKTKELVNENKDVFVVLVLPSGEVVTLGEE